MNDPAKRKFHRLNAMVSFLQLKRQEFQEWFGRMMSACWADDFIRIRLSRGDGGMDGYRLSTETVFQVFAPREVKTSEIVKKIEEDFETAKEKLAERNLTMREWVLVHNDPDDLPHEAVLAIKVVEKANPGIQCRRWEFAAIWDQLSELPDHKRDELLGDAPSLEMLDNLQFGEIIPVVDWLQEAEPPSLPPVDLPEPAKLEHNQIGADNADVVRAGRRRSSLVDEYFRGIPDPDRPEAIAEAYRSKYAALVGSGMNPGSIFRELWVFSGGEHFTGSPTAIAAVSAVMAYFFDRCDIFENPPGAS